MPINNIIIEPGLPTFENRVHGLEDKIIPKLLNGKDVKKDFIVKRIKRY